MGAFLQRHQPVLDCGQRLRPLHGLQQHWGNPGAGRYHPTSQRTTRPGRSSGTIANSVAGFLGTSNATAHFLFSTEDGTISAWSGGSAAVLKVDYSASNAVFKGLAAGASGGNNYLYATDFHSGQVDVFDTNYAPVALAGSFSDTNIPAGYAPFGIQNIRGQLFVTYALQDANKHDDVGGPGTVM